MTSSHTERDTEAVSLGNWIASLILLSIPIVNLVAIIYWAVSSSTLPSKRNFARASILVAVVGFVLYGLALLLFGSLGSVGGAL